MQIHYLQHVPLEGIGTILEWATGRGHRVSSTRLYEEETLPPLDALDWLIIMGGPMNVYQEGEYPWLVAEKGFIRQAIRAGKVLLGICLGAQLIADVLGARVQKNAFQEIGWFPVRKTEEAEGSSLFREFPWEIEVFHWHGDTFDLPARAVHVARSAGCERQAFVYEDRVVGLQFHLEVTEEMVRKMLEEGNEEIATGPFVQSPDQILSNVEGFRRINETVHWFLDRLERLTR
ncbi:MAG: type 1 glutamine amidotransferase [Thermodesulfobacteriota bacterium]